MGNTVGTGSEKDGSVGERSYLPGREQGGAPTDEVAPGNAGNPGVASKNAPLCAYGILKLKELCSSDGTVSTECNFYITALQALQCPGTEDDIRLLDKNQPRINQTWCDNYKLAHGIECCATNNTSDACAYHKKIYPIRCAGANLCG